MHYVFFGAILSNSAFSSTLLLQQMEGSLSLTATNTRPSPHYSRQNPLQSDVMTGAHAAFLNVTGLTYVSMVVTVGQLCMCVYGGYQVIVHVRVR